MRSVFRDGLSADVQDKLIAFAVKSNPNLAVLQSLASSRAMARMSCRSARCAARWPPGWRPPDDRVLRRRKNQPSRLVAALEAGIGQFNIESEEEGLELAEIASEECGLTAQCTLRINPDVDAGTHDKISTGKADNKFGVPIDQAGQIFGKLASHRQGVNLRGVAVHIGSQLGDLAPLENGPSSSWASLVKSLRGRRSRDHACGSRRRAWRALPARASSLPQPGRIWRDGSAGD